MPFDPEIKKKKLVPNALARLFWLKPFEFETPLSIEECARRLQKLPGRMAYIQAKGRVELANVSIEIQSNFMDNQVQFQINSSRRSSVLLRGTIERSEIYETILVRGVPDYGDQELMFVFLPIVVIMVLTAWSVGSLSYSLCMALIPVLGLAIVILSPVVRRRNIIRLLQNVLTEPDESKL